MTRTILLSHNDLDGYTCNLVMNHFYSNVIEFNTSYSTLKEKLDYIKTLKFEYLFITDLYIKDDDIQFIEELINYNHFKKIVFIDHHEYTEKVNEKIKDFISSGKFVMLHDLEKCSSLQLLELLEKSNNPKKNAKNYENLKKLVSYVNAYDLWKKGNDEFKIGWVYNAVFWGMDRRNFLSSLANNDYKMPHYFKGVYKSVLEKKDKYFKQLLDNKLVFEDTKKSLFFVIADNYINFITEDFEDFDIYIILSTYGALSFRLRSEKHLDLKNKIIEKFKNKDTIVSMGGHEKAFGITFKRDVEFDRIFEDTKEIVKFVRETI